MPRATAACRNESGERAAQHATSEAYEAADLLDYARVGAFVRHEWAAGEVSLSAGVLGGSFSGDEASSLALMRP